MLQPCIPKLTHSYQYFKKTDLPIEKLMGNSQVITQLNPKDFITEQFGYRL